ncbi:MAG TPA: primosomal protein N' [Candidatus Saccharimonadales bacterium]|nr:primosomal protein N' [Candidatus Saccharimonadales bacterium]
MQYVEVLVADATYHGSEPLTYSHNTRLMPGSIVIAPLRAKNVLGVVVRTVKKPTFTAKPLLSVPSLPSLPSALLDLLSWMPLYYPAPLGVLAQLFLPKQIPKKPRSLPSFTLSQTTKTLPNLTDDQQQAIDAISGSGLHILHGETGSGKTRVYIELARDSVHAGKSALILTPEIGLTSQLANDFRNVFGERVVVVHSQLTDATRAHIWQELLMQEKPVIVVGARSALFAPIRQLGLIVLDEAHETAYKQDQAPYYHATSVAARLAHVHHAKLVIGSATPLIRDYYIANAKNRPIIRMTQTAAHTAPVERIVHIADLRNRNDFTRSAFFSNALVDAIENTLRKDEQILLFLNRRGTARIIFCDRCGWQAVCPHCDLPLVYHGDKHIMRCHSCEYKSRILFSCPECQNTSIVFKSIGTKAVAAEAERLFPEARIRRFDTDNKKAERIEEHYDDIRAGNIDILVGTQTVAKGLDFPRLSLVGVIIADTSLYFPDFTASERTYQLLTQVIGRVGRGHRQGHVVVQTYAPDSPLLRSILQKDWETFYQTELKEREMFHFPPFCYVLKLVCRRATSLAAQKAAVNFASQLTVANKRLTIEGPTPAFHERIQNKFVWQLIIKSKHRQELVDIINALPSGWSYDIDPMNLL